MAAVLSSKFIGIMIFYIILSYLIGPLIGYYFLGKTTKAAGTGFVVGSVLSIILWYSYGSKMV
uniref:Major facilitator superfamily (MFS) profile domain-containing protein n=1 Tax=viral metagenome TaxID=1070528 RepID=A0A6C0KY05_9ZZZZ